VLGVHIYKYEYKPEGDNKVYGFVVINSDLTHRYLGNIPLLTQTTLQILAHLGNL
jgi:hypothetical protein